MESRLLLREALESFIRSHSYNVVPGVRSVAEIPDEWRVADGPKLVILGAQSAGTALSEAASVGKLWSDSKIILLLEPGSLSLDKLLESQIDACVPLFVSAIILLKVLELIAATDGRVLIVGENAAAAISQDADGPDTVSAREPRQSQVPEATSIAMVAHRQPVAQRASALGAHFNENSAPRVSPLRMLPELSEREIQILHGLVKGHANKVIARECDITEATVKVHIRSILRKIRAGNRTQAAIWALESGYCVDVPRKSH